MAKKADEKERFVALAFCRADILFELDDDHGVVFAAGATPPLLGVQPGKLIGRNFFDLICEDDRDLIKAMFSAAASQGRIDDVTGRLDGVKGQMPLIAISGYRVPDFDNHFFLALKVSPVRECDLRIEDMNRDLATGLMDGDSFGEMAAQKVLAYQRSGGDAQMTMLKVDNLKQLMDKLGVSDRQKLMGRIGSILKENALGKSLAAAIDEENYTLIHTSDVDPSVVGEQIEDAARDAHKDGDMVQGRTHTLDADGAGMNENQVAKALAYCMQKFCANDGTMKDDSLSDSLDAIMVDTVESVNYVRAAAASMEFDLNYMPICDLRLGRVHHFEALTRFREGNPGGPSPYHLISLAEEVGIIHDFDLAVAKKTISDFNNFTSKEVMLPVAINVSGHSIENAYFVTALHQMLDANPHMAGRLMFEITESAKIENLGLVNDVVHGLRSKDYKVCLDDFGAGAASFDYLNSLDVDIVKFDGPVVRRAFESAKGRDLLSSMAKMCGKLGVESVAEMVEEKKMGDVLFKLGIDFGQGWAYGKPTADPMEFAPHFAQRIMDRH